MARTSKPKKHPGGRPTIWKPEFCELSKKRCLLGATNPELANFLGVSLRTIESWLHTKPEFLRAITEGREGVDTLVASALFQRAVGYRHPEEQLFQFQGRVIRAETTKHYPPDTEAAKFWLRNRHPGKWRDKPLATEADDRLNEIADLLRQGPAKPGDQVKDEGGTE